MSGYSKIQFNLASLMNIFYSKLLFIKPFLIYPTKDIKQWNIMQEKFHCCQPAVNEHELWNGEEIPHNSIKMRRTE